MSQSGLLQGLKNKKKELRAKGSVTANCPWRGKTPTLFPSVQRTWGPVHEDHTEGRQGSHENLSDMSHSSLLTIFFLGARWEVTQPSDLVIHPVLIICLTLKDLVWDDVPWFWLLTWMTWLAIFLQIHEEDRVRTRSKPWGSAEQPHGNLNVENREHLNEEAAQHGQETGYKRENLINKYGKENRRQLFLCWNRRWEYVKDKS